MNKYLEYLERTGKSLIIYRKGEIIFQSDKKGIRPHLIAIERLGREALQGTVMVDKIVGRAAALLIMYSGASEVHAALISSGGKELFQKMGVVFTFNEETEAIKVKEGKIFCPFEKMVQGITDPEEAYRKIVAKMKELSAF
jgi:hypothetical protein